jgi:hypothetical protein
MYINSKILNKQSDNKQSNKTQSNNILFNFYPNIVDKFIIPLTIFKNWENIKYSNDNIFYTNNDNITIINSGKYNISHIITSNFNLICKISSFYSFVVLERNNKETIISNIKYWDVSYDKFSNSNLDCIIDITKSTPLQSNEDNPPNVEYDLIKNDILNIKFQMILYPCEQIVIGGVLPLTCNIIINKTIK